MDVKFRVHLSSLIFFLVYQNNKNKGWVFILGNAPTVEFKSLGFELWHGPTMGEDIYAWQGF